MGRKPGLRTKLIVGLTTLSELIVSEKLSKGSSLKHSPERKTFVLPSGEVLFSEGDPEKIKGDSRMVQLSGSPSAIEELSMLDSDTASFLLC